MSTSRRRIAVAFVHGVEINDPQFADGAIVRLRKWFARHLGPSGESAAGDLVVDTVYWAPVLDDDETRLLQRAFDPRAAGYFDRLTSLVTRVNQGSQLALLPLVASGLLRKVPFLPQPDYPTLRWLVTNFLGDAVGYQITPSDRRIYDAVHGCFADTLRRLATEAGPDAPLVVICHSLGTIFASNYLYDLEADTPEKPLIADPVRKRMTPTPLERGETLSHLYTLGSPIALWTLRFSDFGTPLDVPSPRARLRHPERPGEWINFYNKDDLIGFPLKGLSAQYDAAVTRDQEVAVGPFWLSWTPLSHPWYWNDDIVMSPIGAALAKLWAAL